MTDDKYVDAISLLLALTAKARKFGGEQLG